MVDSQRWGNPKPQTFGNLYGPTAPIMLGSVEIMADMLASTATIITGGFKMDGEDILQTINGSLVNSYTSLGKSS